MYTEAYPRQGEKINVLGNRLISIEAFFFYSWNCVVLSKILLNRFKNQIHPWLKLELIVKEFYWKLGL